MLTNFDIEKLCRKLDLPLVGVFSKDELKNQPTEVGSYYINLMDSDKENEDGNNGSHWVYARIYYDDDESDSSEDSVVVCNAIYFDPFGFGMPKDVANFLSKFKPVYCSNREIQNINSTECGWYCIACDYDLTHYRLANAYKGRNETYFKEFEKFINYWSDDVKKNLTKLKEFFNRIGIHYL